MARELGHELSPIEEVQAEILSHIAPLPAERCGLSGAYGRVLRQDLVAPADVPPFDNSAMDGYAVRSADLAGAVPGSPAALRVVEALAAGAVPRRSVEAGTTIRIMTGAPVPAGADCVVPHELARAEGERVLFEAPARAGANVRRAGCDVRAGKTALCSGERLRGPQMAVAASLGCSALLVARRPRVAILSPGDELVEPGEPLPPGKVRSANQYALIGLLTELGVEPIPLGIVPDDRARIRAALRRAAEAGADAVVTTGGVSAGDHDHVQEIAREEGKPGRVYKVAMRPGKPQAFALVDGIPLFGLPGNPASAIISFCVFVRPALRKMLGASRLHPERFPARFATPYRWRTGRTFLLRVRVEPDPAGGFRIGEVGEQDSSVLSSLARANALVVLPADRDAAQAGESFPAEWIDG